MRKPSIFWLVIKLFFCLMIGAPFVIAGLCCVLSIILSPVGFLLFALGSAPFHTVYRNYIKKLVKIEQAEIKQRRTKSMHNYRDRPRPWEE